MSARGALLLVLALAAGGCASLIEGTAGTGDQLQTVVGSDAGIYRGQELFLGERVVVAGTVGEVLTAGTFTLLPEPASEAALLVVDEGPLREEEGQALEITGILRTLDRTDPDLARGAERYQGDLYLVAEEYEPLSSSADFADEASFRGAEVVATGRVRERLGAAAFVLEGGLNTEEELLVVADGAAAVDEGDTVAVRGGVGQVEEAELADALDASDLGPVLEAFAGLHYLAAGEVEVTTRR